MSETRYHPRRVAVPSSSEATRTRPARRAAPAPTPASPWPAEIPLRLLRAVGTEAVLRSFWGDDCPNAFGGGYRGCHNGERVFASSTVPRDWTLGDGLEHAEADYPTTCDHCPAIAPPSSPDGAAPAPGVPRVIHVINHRIVYQTPDGEQIHEGQRRPGDAWIANHEHDGDGRCYAWDNCDGRHLVILMPGGGQWDTSSRASNCTRRDDRTHRCWVVRGDIEHGDRVTIDKAGDTCTAGAGSIWMDAPKGYHGHLVEGVLKRC